SRPARSIVPAAISALILRFTSWSFGLSFLTCSQQAIAFCQLLFDSWIPPANRKNSASLATPWTDSTYHWASALSPIWSAASAATRAAPTSQGLLTKAPSQTSSASGYFPFERADFALIRIG